MFNKTLRSYNRNTKIIFRSLKRICKRQNPEEVLNIRPSPAWPPGRNAICRLRLLCPNSRTPNSRRGRGGLEIISILQDIEILLQDIEILSLILEVFLQDIEMLLTIPRNTSSRYRNTFDNP